MTPEELQRQIAQGEGQSIEFKRCGNVPHDDTFETICSFANRIGGSIYLGVGNDGSILGVNSKSVLEIERNVINVTNNKSIFNVAPSVEFERIEIDGKAVIRIWVPMGPSVYRFKNVVYDRIADVDTRVENDDQISLMYIRKKGYYSEQKVYPYITIDDLRPDLIERARARAVANRRDHPWRDLDDESLLRAAGLYAHDKESGKSGYTLAAALLLGTDELIRSVCPGYVTDAIVRIEDVDRYDDRLMVRTNLIEAYDRISEFCRRHMPDRFLLEGDARVSARDVIIRELVTNILIHREFLGAVPAQVTIDKDGIHTRNASKSIYSGQITLTDFSPRPKNPLIADFFTQIGLAEEMGSGTRNLYKYSEKYTGTLPELFDGDVFDARVAIGRPSQMPAGKPSARRKDVRNLAEGLFAKHETITAQDLAEEAGISIRTAQRHISKLLEEGVIRAEGSTSSRVYKLKG